MTTAHQSVKVRAPRARHGTAWHQPGSAARAKALPTPSERAAVGLAARAAVPPASHAQFSLGPGGRDPVEVLEQQAASRVAELIPIRYGRMLVSPFTFYRGAAAVMAADLADTPASGLSAHLCGDAHLSNFGLFASPERRLMFDLNDFDEAHRGPWEWDVKRLAASLEVAARDNGYRAEKRRDIQIATVTRYQQAMAEFAGMRELDVWYSCIDVDAVKDAVTAPLRKGAPKAVDKALDKARTRDSLRAFDKLTAVVDGSRRIVADPPLIVPLRDLAPEVSEEAAEEQLSAMLASYRRTLDPDRRSLLDAFEIVDIARKVVGVGSVGTRCWIVLLQGRDNDDPLFLQVKEAQRSVLADYVHDQPSYRNEGERVVVGQRAMQASSDIFLGWDQYEGLDGIRRDFYFRQLADWKGSADIETMRAKGMRAYGELCGWTLARAHARTGDRIAIASYLGDDDAFAQAIADFSAAYADQNEKDFAALGRAEHDGRITVQTGL